MRKFRKIVGVLALTLASATACAEDTERVNLWPVFYYDPPDSMTCLPFFARDRHSFYSLPLCCGNDFVFIPPMLSWYSRSASGLQKYTALCGLFGTGFNDGNYAESWLFPLFYRDDECFVTPLVGWSGRFQGIPALLSWHETSDSRESYRLLLGMGSVTWNGDLYDRSWLLPLYYHDQDLFLSPLLFRGKDWGMCPAALSWYRSHGADESYLALLGLGGLLRDRGKYDCSWLLPLYYHDEHQFLSPIVGWGDGFEALPALLSWHTRSGQDEIFATLLGLGAWRCHCERYESSWLFPIFYHNTDGTWETPLYGHKKNGWSIPALMTYIESDGAEHETWVSYPLLSSGELQGGDKWSTRLCLGLLFSADYASADSGSWSFLMFLANYRKTRDRWDFISLLPYSAWTENVSRRNSLYGYCLLKSEEEGYSRWNFLWKIFDYVEEKGNVSVDAFPGITYDATADGAVDVSFWYRLFRYRSTASGLTDLSILFIPFK